MLLESRSGRGTGVERIPAGEGAGEPARVEEAQRARQGAGGGIWRGESTQTGADEEEECGAPALRGAAGASGEQERARDGRGEIKYGMT